MKIEQRNKLLSVVFGIVIIILGYFLYHAIVDPYQQVLEQEHMTERVRQRMENVREALQRYKNDNNGFPPSDGGLDSLVQFLKTDSLMVAIGDTLFEEIPPSTYSPDSITYSPRPPHNRFEYALNDSINPELYLLQDPDTDDKIGSLEQTTLLNAASWE